MASGMKRVTKEELLERLSDYKDSDLVGVICSVQKDRESPCNEILMFFDPIENLL